MTKKDCLKEMPERLLDWYDKGRRILPWREAVTPYHIWISEIMLQQTRVVAVEPYYARFIKALPDIKSLSKASEEQLLKLWEGLGYYNRVRNLRKAAQIIEEQYQGMMPSEVSELMKLPGIGSYTSGAIASIAYHKVVPAVDGNVLRVYSRLIMDGENILDVKVKRKVEDIFRSIIPESRPGDFNQALMELGAMVCQPNGQPRCAICPVQKICRAYKENCVMEYPVKLKKRPRKVEGKTVLLIQTEKKVAIQKRSDKGLLAGMYEFPCIAGKQSSDAVLEYIKKLGFYPIQIHCLGEVKHIFSHLEWHMIGFLIRIDEFQPIAEIAEKEKFIFVEKMEVEQSYPIPTAYAAYAKYLNIIQGADVFQ